MPLVMFPPPNPTPTASPSGKLWMVIAITNSQMAICSIGIAVNRRYKDSQTGEWKEQPTFIDVTIFGKRGEAFERFHKKGASCFIEGSLRMDQWEDKQTGAKRSKLYVVADDWEFVGGGRGAGQGGGGDYDEPRSSSQGGGGGGGYGGGGGGQPGPDYLEVDDTPF